MREMFICVECGKPRQRPLDKPVVCCWMCSTNGNLLARPAEIRRWKRWGFVDRAADGKAAP